jgi:hypothetical protein
MQPTEDEVIAIKTKPQQQKLSQFFVKRPNKKKATSKTRVAAVPSSLSGTARSSTPSVVVHPTIPPPVVGNAIAKKSTIAAYVNGKGGNGTALMDCGINVDNKVLMDKLFEVITYMNEVDELVKNEKQLRKRKRSGT